ncbi:MAG TPA: pyridoxamine 5'-phosphate oxidase family protein [Marmoricola sp.]|nr:pyridoxamine 5'-phosphate oxidase family protein [Marmoricola sp.]
MDNLVELTVDECLALLRRKPVGRVAMVTPAGLRILPVSYSVVDERIVFRTLPYGEIANNVADAEVAFEVDDLDEELRHGWSVMAAGPCHRIEDPDEVHLVHATADPQPWVDGQRNLYFRIDWTTLTGRQVGIAGRPSLVGS